jgi:hypothetical protein
MRFTYETYVYKPTVKKLVWQPYLAAYDGNVCKTFDAGHADHDLSPQGVIRAEHQHFDVKNVIVRPLLLCYRPFHAEIIGEKASNLRMTGQVAIVGGRRCVSLEHFTSLANPAGERFIYWVDPERDYSVARITLQNHKIVLLQIDIRYSRDTDHGWVPTSWTTVNRRSDGTLDEERDASVREYRFNEVFKDDEFIVDFPAGTVVTDMSSSAANRLPSYYVALGGGMKQEIYDGSPRTFLGVSNRNWAVVVTCVCGAAAAVGAVIVVRRRRRLIRDP